MPPKKITRRQYESNPADYRGTVAGQPYLVYMDPNGRTAYGPVEFIPDPFDLSFDATYELALRVGNARFGSECKHETVIRGRCADCQRRLQ